MEVDLHNEKLQRTFELFQIVCTAVPAVRAESLIVHADWVCAVKPDESLFTGKVSPPINPLYYSDRFEKQNPLQSMIRFPLWDYFICLMVEDDVLCVKMCEVWWNITNQVWHFFSVRVVWKSLPSLQTTSQDTTLTPQSRVCVTDSDICPLVTFLTARIFQNRHYAT